MIMPEFGGAATFEALYMIDPSVRVLLSSGYSVEGQAKEIIQNGCKGFIQKPFSMTELSRKIRKTLCKKNVGKDNLIPADSDTRNQESKV
jgi:DNA-binding NarL/FixJ family response regulator